MKTKIYFQLSYKETGMGKLLKSTSLQILIKEEGMFLLPT